MFMLVKVRNLKFLKAFGEIEKDVLFGSTLLLKDFENLRL